MDKFRIRWVDSVHTCDDFELILQALEVGRDEGPIILVPRRTARRLGTKAGADYQALVFENPDWLGAHLVEYRDQRSRPSTWCNFGGGLGSSSCGLCGNV